MQIKKRDIPLFLIEKALSLEKSIDSSDSYALMKQEICKSLQLLLSAIFSPAEGDLEREDSFFSTLTDSLSLLFQATQASMVTGSADEVLELRFS